MIESQLVRRNRECSVEKNWTSAGLNGLPVPVSVSWHLWPTCNFKCAYCFAVFDDISEPPLSEHEALNVLSRLRHAGTEKVTFVGGEPTLCPHLLSLARHAKQLGLITMLVTNGSRLHGEYRDRILPFLDWVALSIDASRGEIMHAMGRGGAGHFEHLRSCWRHLASSPDLRLKVNTVVTRLNVHDDMRALIRELRPSRWKVFQVLPVRGQNSGRVEDLLITEDAFRRYIERHRELIGEGLGPVAETNADLTGTYLMLDSRGRFFHNRTGTHIYTDSVLDVGVWEAVRQVEWNVDGFLSRGGFYDWKPLIRGGRSARESVADPTPEVGASTTAPVPR